MNGDIDDRYATLGHRSQIGGWNTDLSQTYGYNRLRYNISNTINASLANQNLLGGGPGVSPSRFDAGGFSFEQLTTNFDLNRFYPGVLSGMNLAFGAEYRRENYQIMAGERGSYVDADGVGIGGNAGSQGFPGFQPGDQTDKRRNSWAAYVDVETDITQRLKAQTALRYERFSDFGSTLTGKLASSYRIDEKLLLRTSGSTGFRAPSLQQVYFSSTFTDFISGVPLDVVLAPNGGAIANAAGIPKLKEEKSKSFTLGLTWSPNSALAGFEDVLLSERERLFIEQGGPRSKATLGFNFITGAWESDLKVIHFGTQTLGTFSGTAAGVPNARYAAKTSADLSLTYSINKTTKITIGGTNIFNVKPSKQDPNETDNGFIYDSVQFGLNGAAYFARFWKKF